MPHDIVRIEGSITDIFFHRFVIETTMGRKVLADLGPKGVEAFPLLPGLDVVVEGELKPSEVKVARIARKGGAAIEIEHKKPPHHKPGHPRGPKPHHGPGESHHPPADPALALSAVEAAGFQTVGVPRRKPKHFEVLGRRGDTLIECHVTLEGEIRKEKPVAAGDPKWIAHLDAA